MIILKLIKRLYGKPSPQSTNAPAQPDASIQPSEPAPEPALQPNIEQPTDNKEPIVDDAKKAMYERIVASVCASCGGMFSLDLLINEYLPHHWDELCDIYGYDRIQIPEIIKAAEAMMHHGELCKAEENTWQRPAQKVAEDQAWLNRAWADEIKRITAKHDAGKKLDAAETATILRIWAEDRVKYLSQADSDAYARLLLAIAPDWALTPWMYFRRHGNETVYSEYRDMTECNYREGNTPPMPVIRAVVRELALGSLDRIARARLAECLWIWRIMPDDLQAVHCGGEAELPKCRQAYAIALTEYNVPAREQAIKTMETPRTDIFIDRIRKRDG